VGASVVLDRLITLPPATVTVVSRTQREMILVRTDSVAQCIDRITCDDNRSYSINETVVKCAKNTALIDGYFATAATPAGAGSSSAKPVLVVYQDKHSELDTRRAVVTGDNIRSWHASTVKAMQNWSDRYDLLYLYVTNRQLIGSEPAATLVAACQSLLVVTHDQLGEYLSPTLAARGLLAPETADPNKAPGAERERCAACHRSFKDLSRHRKCPKATAAAAHS